MSHAANPVGTTPASSRPKPFGKGKWTDTLTYLVANNYVSRDKVGRYSRHGNYIFYLKKRGYLQENVHWTLGEPVFHIDTSEQSQYLRHEMYDYEAVCALLTSAEFVLEPEVWLAFNTEEENDITPDLYNLLEELGLELQGYDRDHKRIVYTAKDLAQAEEAVKRVKKQTWAGILQGL